MCVAEKDFERAFGFGHGFVRDVGYYTSICGGKFTCRGDPADRPYDRYHSLRVCPIRVFVIVIPPQWIGPDIFGDVFHFPFVADDAFIIIPLPDRDSVRSAQ